MVYRTGIMEADLWKKKLYPVGESETVKEHREETADVCTVEVK